MVKQSQPIPSVVTPPNLKKLEPRHSEEVNDILTKMPSWLIRWGITVLFIGVLGILAMSWFIQYPDVVQTRVSLSATQSPVSVIPRATGALVFHIKENDAVKKGQYLGYIENAAEFKNIQALKRNIKETPALGHYDEYWQLGELQPYFNNLISALKKAKNVVQSKQDDRSRISLITQQIAETVASKKNAKHQVTIAQQEYSLAQKTLKERYQVLLLQGAISRMTYEKYTKEMVQLKSIVEQKQIVVNDITNRLILLKKEKENLGFNRNIESVSSTNEIEDAYSRLKSHLALWEQKYLLQAPVEGKIEFLDFTKNNRYVQAEEEIARIVPLQEGTLYGEVFLPPLGFGKVELGQQVLLELDHFPKKEFGQLTGTLEVIAATRTSQGYKAKIALSNGMTSTFQKELTFQHGMEGTAKIITKEIRLFHRFVYQLREVFQ